MKCFRMCSNLIFSTVGGNGCQFPMRNGCIVLTGFRVGQIELTPQIRVNFNGWVDKTKTFGGKKKLLLHFLACRGSTLQLVGLAFQVRLKHFYFGRYAKKGKIRVFTY